MTTPKIPTSVPGALVGAVGARACNGITALQVAMCIRADKFVPRESHLVDRAGDPIATGRLASIGDDVVGLARLVELGGPALAQAAAPLRGPEGTFRSPLRLFCAVPERDRPGADPAVARALLPALAARSHVPIDVARSRLFPSGRAGGVQALEAALLAVRDGDDPVLVGGVDSFFHPDTLEWLDRELRLHSLTAENGFIPGEGAAFLLLGTAAGLGGSPRMARVLGVTLAEEPHPWGSARPCLADGMTVAASAAVAGAPGHAVGWVLTDVVDERHRVDEWAFVAARIAHALAMDHEHQQPLLSTGDLGAASAAMLIGLAATHWSAGSAPSDLALVACHSDGGLRGAVLLEAGPAAAPS